MGDSIGQVLPFAIGVAISPLPIVAVVMMLSTPRGRLDGPAFLLGWIVALAVLGTVVLLLSSSAGASDNGQPSDGTNYLKLGLGILLVGVAWRQFKKRPKEGEEAELPAWMKTIDSFGPMKALATSIGLSALNPKNIILTIGAGAAIAQTGASTADQAVALAVFVLIGALGPGIPVGIYFMMGDRADSILADLRAWMTRENATIMAVICLVIAAKLIGDAVGGF